MLQELLTAVIAAGCAGLVYAAAAVRIVKQYERGVVFRLGRLTGDERQPGLAMIIPFADRLYKVNMQIVTLPIPAQEGITRDNVTVRVDAVVYFRVVDAANALIRVEDYKFAVSQMAQTSLRSIIGKSDLDDLLSNREKLNQGLELMIDSPAVGWGVQIDRVEIKDVSLPDTMKRSMARQAEADRERRARIINADAELQASRKLAEAAQQMEDTPAALQLRLLQTVVAVAAEKNSTLVLPFPVELLRFLEKAQQPTEPEVARAAARRAAAASRGAAQPTAVEPPRAAGQPPSSEAAPAGSLPPNEAARAGTLPPPEAARTGTPQPSEALQAGNPPPTGAPGDGTVPPGVPPVTATPPVTAASPTAAAPPVAATRRADADDPGDVPEAAPRPTVTHLT
ncbi:slipin family protein [Streptomyces tropicalis]|uniref:SPFH domain-containing protein n=1 Tax=Streptomyces tropicalis TaxID=3034234 RepID=A0ABT6A264_9ACTN|nr:SPFH domain-containing protein [Streptomyces tropicalis]MDF3298476.1 SPFH domain-containing protein [Streptomyces tropicalis]